MKIITDEACTQYGSPGHPERPARVAKTLELLRSQKELELTFVAPTLATDEDVLRAHTRELLESVEHGTGDFDGDTARHPNIETHTRRSVGGALLAMQSALKGELAFSLLRPPGHHATRNHAMGFCYFNGIAIAALSARARGVERVAVFDFDVHHGNGTEAVLKDVGGTAFYSIHQHPCYPGTGTENVGNNCFNFPVAPKTKPEEYRKVLSKALAEMVKFKPTLIGVSAGFDAYKRDPIAQETLDTEDFHWLGGQIRALGIPAFHVLEGGYSTELPNLILAYLRGLAGK